MELIKLALLTPLRVGKSYLGVIIIGVCLYALLMALSYSIGYL